MAGKKQHSPLGRELIAGMEEVAAYARGEIELPTRVVEVPEAVDVAAMQKRLRLSQARFAERFGFAVAAVRAGGAARRRGQEARAGSDHGFSAAPAGAPHVARGPAPHPIWRPSRRPSRRPKAPHPAPLPRHGQAAITPRAGE